MSLSYPNLMVILEHMDPNVRFNLHLTCPAFRDIEKRAPLRIQSLDFDTLSFSMNSVDYQIRRFQKYVGDDPKHYKSYHETNGYPTDKSPYCHDEVQRLPGDVLITGDKPIDHLRYSENQHPLEFSDYIRLSLFREGKAFKTENLVYITSIWNAVRYLTRKFLSGREVLKVNTLKISSEHLIRLPEDLRIKTSILEHLSKKGGFDEISTIIAPESYPLKSYTTYQSNVRSHPLLRYSELIIHSETLIDDRIAPTGWF